MLLSDSLASSLMEYGICGVNVLCGSAVWEDAANFFLSEFAERLKCPEYDFPKNGSLPGSIFRKDYGFFISAGELPFCAVNGICQEEQQFEALHSSLVAVKQKYPQIEYEGYIAYPISNSPMGSVFHREISSADYQSTYDFIGEVMRNILTSELYIPEIPISIKGFNFVVTGKLSLFDNRDKFAEYVKTLGGTMTGSISKQTNYLINNDLTSKSSKNVKAKSLGVPIINDHEFAALFGDAEKFGLKKSGFWSDFARNLKNKQDYEKTIEVIYAYADHIGRSMADRAVRAILILSEENSTVRQTHTKCLNCGKISDSFLCEDCRTPSVLDKIFRQIQFFKAAVCENMYLYEYASGLADQNAVKDIIPSILDLFDFGLSEFYYCLYYRMRRDERFEAAAMAYLEKHELSDTHTQDVLYCLIESYIPNDFVKPQKWCALIAETPGLCCELYAIAAKYYAMIGEYDLSDAMSDKCMDICNMGSKQQFIFYSPENMILRIQRQKSDTHNYRTKKPYWPATEERRRAVSVFYDAKGIRHPRIENRPAKIKEQDFKPIRECFEDHLTDYCAFWCAESFSLSAAKGIYQIAAVKVRDGEITDTFEELVRPWDGISERKEAARKVGVELSVIEDADDVDLVMPKFFAFVGEDVLISTGALGNQAKLMVRAARYSGMNEIKNEFYDILDLAADTSADFDLANNTREYLLNHFSIAEGNTTLEKAVVNKKLYDALVRYDG